jgi:Ig-like domain-containing protein/immunoglobulin I-set domain protein
VPGYVVGAVYSASTVLTINVNGPPAFAQQPQNVAAVPGGTAAFTAQVSNPTGVTYQWRKNGVPITGATGATLAFANVQLTDGGQYSVVATNSFGSTTSAIVVLSVGSGAPVIAGQPVPLTVASGSSAVFRVFLSGAAPFNFQWLKNGVVLAGAPNSPTLWVQNSTAADAGTYACKVTNAFGTTQTNNTSLAVVTTANPGRLINMSILTGLGAGETMSMGTVLGGSGTSGTKPLLARAVGPSLALFGITTTLPDPTMTLVTTPANTTVATNNDWNGDATLGAIFTQVSAFGYISPTSKDAAIYQANLPAGNYAVQVSDTGGRSGSVITELYDASPAYTPATPRLINVSVIKQIAQGSSLSAGFVIGGSTAKTVLIRAIGPGLSAFGVGGPMTDPQLQIISNGNTVGSNDNWGGDPQLSAAGDAVGAFKITNVASSDAMVFLTLAPGTYSATVIGVGGAGGTALVEVYEVP